MASASQVKLVYIEEATFGTTPAAPTMKSVPFNTGDAFANARDTLQSAQVQTTRQPRNLRMGVNQPAKTLTGELQWQSFDDFLAAGLGDVWEGGDTLTVSVTTTASEFVLAASTWAIQAPNLAVGNYIVADDDGTARVLYVSAIATDTMTVLDADGSSAASLTIDAEASDHTIYVCAVGAQVTCSATDELVFVATSLTATLDNTFTDGWDDLGFKPGDNIFFGETVSNNGWNKISSIDATGYILTLASAPTNETIDTAITFNCASDAGLINNGNDLPSFAMEEQFADVTTNKYRAINGVKIGQVQFAIQPSAMIMVTFELIGATIADFAATSIATAVTEYTQREAFDSFTGAVTQDDSAGQISGYNLTINNQENRNFNLFERNANAITDGTPQMTGDLSAYFDDSAQSTIFFNETATEIIVRMVDPDGNAYVIDIQTAQYTGDTISIGDIDITEQLPYAVQPNTTAGGYEVQIRRQPVAH